MCILGRWVSGILRTCATYQPHRRGRKKRVDREPARRTARHNMQATTMTLPRTSNRQDPRKRRTSDLTFLHLFPESNFKKNIHFQLTRVSPFSDPYNLFPIPIARRSFTPRNSRCAIPSKAGPPRRVSGDKLISLNGNSRGARRERRRESGRLHAAKRGKREETHILAHYALGRRRRRYSLSPPPTPPLPGPRVPIAQERKREGRSRVHLLDTEPDLKTDENKAGAPKVFSRASRGWRTSVSGTRRPHICASLNAALDYSPRILGPLRFFLQGAPNETRARVFHQISEATSRASGPPVVKSHQLEFFRFRPSPGTSRGLSLLFWGHCGKSTALADPRRSLRRKLDRGTWQRNSLEEEWPLTRVKSHGIGWSFHFTARCFPSRN